MNDISENARLELVDRLAGCAPADYDLSDALEDRASALIGQTGNELEEFSLQPVADTTETFADR